MTNRGISDKIGAFDAELGDFQAAGLIINQVRKYTSGYEASHPELLFSDEENNQKKQQQKPPRSPHRGFGHVNGQWRSHGKLVPTKGLVSYKIL